MSVFNGPIKDVCLGIYDGPHATPKESDTGPIFLGIRNVTADGRLDFSEIRHVSEQEFPQWTRRVTPEKDDIVFSYEATLHLYALIPEGFHGCLGRRMALVRPDPSKVVSRYLHYYFLSPIWTAVMKSNVITGATVDRIPLARFPNFPVRIPELEEQKRIADILSTYDDLIENNRRRIALLEQSARLLYREWFVYFRFPGHEHANVVDGVPVGWQRKPLGDLLTLQRGFDLPASDRLDGNVPIYAATGIHGQHNKAMVTGPGVITGRSGSLGKVLYSHADFWPLNTTLWVKEFKSISPEFAFFMLASLGLEQFNGGAAVPTLNRNDVHRIEVNLPSKALMDEFTEIVLVQLQQVDKLTQYNVKLREARDLLLPRLMSGEIAV